jgi:ectoine hydroxylase-related dioxygenase (phytanoyl-CoA dioxygenase family)
MTDTEYPLTDAQILDYRSNGFIALRDVFVGEELRQLRDAVTAAVKEERNADVIGRIRGEDPSAPPRARGAYEELFIQRVNLWTRHADVKHFVHSHRLANIAARLEGVSMRLWHDQALFKEPHLGNNRTPWHQDAVYWPHQQREHQTTIWIALSDATIVNGCMSFVPGSHRLGVLPKIDLVNPQDLFDYAPQFKPTKPVVCELIAGSATFHNGLTFHFAGPNKSEHLREAFAIIYMPDGTTYDGQRHCVTEPLGLPIGAALDGELFPRLS